MSNQDRPATDDQSGVKPAHPAPAQSPRSLGDDQLPQRDSEKPGDSPPVKQELPD